MSELDAKHAEMIHRAENPPNGGMPLAHLIRHPVTPKDEFYVRSHAPTPVIDQAHYVLKIGGSLSQPMSISLPYLRETFAHRSVQATLQCAGNRRQELIDIEPVSDQVAWGAEAVGTAHWGGVPLREVLLAAGVDEQADRHVAFSGMDQITDHGDAFGYGGSIPLHKAMQPEVLLVTEMNGEPLPPLHGGPLRVVVPGYIGARSVKWVHEITVQDGPSENYFQARAYKIFPPHIRSENADWESGLMLGEFPVNAVICEPAPDATLKSGQVIVLGYAVSGGGRSIERVDVSTDGGNSWATAHLHGDQGRWAWRLWEITLDLAAGDHTILVRGWDSSANTQPEDARGLWNFKGYMNNAWHRVRVRVEG